MSPSRIMETHKLEQQEKPTALPCDAKLTSAAKRAHGSCVMSTRHNVDHSTGVLNRLLDSVNTDTCDVTFVLLPSDCASVWSPLQQQQQQQQQQQNITSHQSSTMLHAEERDIASQHHDDGASLTINVYNHNESRSHDGRFDLDSDDGERPDTKEPTATQQRQTGDSRRSPGSFALSRAAGSLLAASTLAPPTPPPPPPRPPPQAERERVATSHRSQRFIVDDEEEAEGRRGEDQVEFNRGSNHGGAGSSEAIGDEIIDDAAAGSPAAFSAGKPDEFRCHRFLFASCSEYFRVLLYGGMSESQTRRVELRGVGSEAFQTIITYVYTGRALITADNVMETFSLAHRFDMRDLLRSCAEVLDQCMNPSDVCHILDAAEYYGHVELAAKCWYLIKNCTPIVLKNEGFLELPWYLVKSLVREGDLQVDEADLFAAAQAWVDRDPAERLQHVEELFSHFRLPLISLRDLMSVVRPSSLVPAEALLDAVTYHSDPELWSGDSLMIRPRGKRFTWDPSSLAAGAWVGDNELTVTTSVADWVGVYGNRVMRCGFHRWSVKANKLGHSEKKTNAWKAIVGVAWHQTQDLARPFLPLSGFVVGTGGSKLCGHTVLDDYSSVTMRDGDVITVVYDADDGRLCFFLNGTSLGEAYGSLMGPVVAALAINAAGAMWSLDMEPA